MKARHLALAVTLAALLTAGCDDAATGPQSRTADAGLEVQTAASPSTQTFTIPVPSPLYMPCPVAGGDPGEFVDLTGSLRVVMTEVVSNSGNYLFRFHIFGSGIEGTGRITGATYRPQGGQNVTLTTQADALPMTFTSTYVFHVIGQGQAPDWHVHETLHLTVDADGRLTADVENSRVACR